jgi:hypothetical protein
LQDSADLDDHFQGSRSDRQHHSNQLGQFYVSPYFTVTEAMQRIAVLYLAPYGSGAGTFVIEGTANGAILGLTPTRALIELPGAQSIPVVWRAVSPC